MMLDVVDIIGFVYKEVCVEYIMGLSIACL